MLPLAYPVHSESPEKARNTPFIVLNPTEKPFELKGEGFIKYPFEGTYDYLYFTTEDMKKFQDESGRSFILSNADHRKINGTITIESSEITSNLQTNNIFLTLTFVAIAFGSIELLQNRFKS